MINMFPLPMRWMLIIAMVSAILSQTAYAQSRSNVLWFETGPPIRNCQDVLKNNNKSSSGVYTVYPYNCCPDRPLQVYCDMDTDGGGWTVIQRRDDFEPQEDFYRTWMEYALGFGDITRDFWLGLDHIHALTDQKLSQLRFDLQDFENNTRWAQYQFFYVHERSLNYLMEVNGYLGDAGDSFSTHNGHAFSTKDKDLDTNEGGSCAVSYKGAWWYTACHGSNLNGEYLRGNHTTYANGMIWKLWRGYHYSLKRSEMKIRSVF